MFIIIVTKTYFTHCASYKYNGKLFLTDLKLIKIWINVSLSFIHLWPESIISIHQLLF